MRLITGLVLALLLVAGQGGTAQATPDQLAQSTLDRAAASLAVEKATLAPKETLRVSFTASKTYPHDTFVFIVPSGTPHGSLKTLWEHDVAWQRLEKRTGGVLEFTAPTAEGAYDLRMAESAEGTELASISVTVRVDRDAASLSLPKPVFAPQEAMPVTFSASATYPHDSFVFIVPHGTPDEGTKALWNHDLAWQRLERRADGVLEFNAPTAEGTYDLRMAETSNDVVLTVLTVTVAVDREAASLTVPKPVFAPQEAMPVTFTASETYPHDSFVFIVPHGTPDEGTKALWNHDLAWQRLERRAGGVLAFTAPKAEGTYDLRMAETSNDVVLTVLTFTVAVDREAASLTVPKPVFAPQEPMPVTFTASETYPHDSFVFIVPHGTPDEGTKALWNHDLAWQRLERRAGGVLAFTAPKAEGTYDLRMAETSNDVVLTVLTFTVAVDRAAASLSLPQSVYSPQEAMPVAFTASETYPHDTFVFLVPHAAPHEGTRALWNHDLAWQRLERRADGVLAFTAPKAEGTYELRMAETSNNKELVSVTFRVAEAGAGGGPVSARGDSSAHDGLNPPISVSGTDNATGTPGQTAAGGPSKDPLLDNWNSSGCGFTDTSSFTLNRDQRVRKLVIWYSWKPGEETVDYQLSGPGKTHVGRFSKGSCHPYQTQWCRGEDTPGLGLAAGDYTIRVANKRLCQNAGSGGNGFAQVFTEETADVAGSGWRVNLGEVEVSGDIIATTPPGDGLTSYYIAPPVFHGDWTGARALVLEKKSSGGNYYSSGAGANGDVILSGPNGTARYLFEPDHSGAWTAYRVPLDGMGWTLDGGATSLAAVLSAVTDFRIRAEYGYGDDTSAIRGVMLDNQGPVASPGDGGAAGYAGVWDSSEGRMTLTASGNRVSGTYTQDNGAIVGTVTGMRFDGVWIENGSNRRCDTAKDGRHHWGRLVFDRTGDTLTGQWSYCDEELGSSWTATRVGPVPGATADPGSDTADSDTADSDTADPDEDEDEKPDLTIREDLDVSGLIQQIEAIMAEEEGQ